MKRIIAVLFVVLTLLTIAPLNGLANIDLFADTVEAAEKEFKTGDKLFFGSYPQSKVTDSSLISKLTAAAPATSNWTSYNYYADNKQSDYMKYYDLTYNGNRYRGVYFTKYRPYYWNTTSSAYQSKNGYYTSTIYWFKYESLTWRILDPQTGYVICETIIDSQAFNNEYYSKGTDAYGNTAYYNDKTYTHLANNWEYSTIRKWLNESFYTTAFSLTERQQIPCTKLTTPAYSTSYSAYDVGETGDYVFLPSYQDMINTSYGFSSKCDNEDINRRAYSSDYAKSQGVYVNSSYTDNDGKYTSNYRLRSASFESRHTTGVGYESHVSIYWFTDDTIGGIRPACILSKLECEHYDGDNDGKCDACKSLIKSTVYSLSIDGISDGKYIETDKNNEYKTVYSDATTNDQQLYYDLFNTNSVDNWTIDSANQKKWSFTNTTEETLKKKIQSSFENSTDNDVCFFAYSGHSMWNEATKNSKDYGISLGSSCYEWLDLAQDLSDVAKGKIIVFLNACFSECFIKYGVRKLDETTRNRFIVFTACSELEESKSRWSKSIFNNKDHGLYTYSIGKATGYYSNKMEADTAKDGNKNGEVNAYELSRYLDNNKAKGTTPHFYGDPDYVLFKFDRPIVSLQKTKFEYTGKDIKAGVVVKTVSGNEIDPKFYSVSYKNCKKIGTATAIVEFKKPYSGGREISYTIIPKKTSITSTEIKSTSVKLTWKNVDNITGYKVYYRLSNGEWKLFKEVDKKTTSLNVTGLKASTLYGFKVNTINKNYYNSSLETLVTTNLAVPKNLKGTVTPTQISLNWDKVSGASYYRLEKYDSGNKKWVEMKTISATTFKNTSLKSGTQYKYRVFALDKNKKRKSDVSSTLTISTLCNAPTIKLTSTKSKTTTVTITKVTGAKSYMIYTSTDNQKWTKVTTTTKTTYNLTSLTGGKKIYVKVVAVNADKANSAYSRVASITVKK